MSTFTRITDSQVELNLAVALLLFVTGTAFLWMYRWCRGMDRAQAALLVELYDTAQERDGRDAR